MTSIHEADGIWLRNQSCKWFCRTRATSPHFLCCAECSILLLFISTFLHHVMHFLLARRCHCLWGNPLCFQLCMTHLNLLLKCICPCSSPICAAAYHSKQPQKISPFFLEGAQGLCLVRQLAAVHRIKSWDQLIQAVSKTHLFQLGSSSWNSVGSCTIQRENKTQNVHNISSFVSINSIWMSNACEVWLWIIHWDQTHLTALLYVIREVNWMNKGDAHHKSWMPSNKGHSRTQRQSQDTGRSCASGGNNGSDSPEL